MHRPPLALLLLLALAFAAAPAAALTVVYSVSMTGAQVVGGGDPDGTATGTISLDDTARFMSWSFTYANIGVPTHVELHGPNAPAGTDADLYVGLLASTSGGAGTLINNAFSGPQLNLVNARPADFYVLIFTSEFPLGAVRGQLGTIVPEPGMPALLAVALAGLTAWRRPGRKG